MRLNFLTTRLGLVLAGVSLGLLARYLLGPPVADTQPSMKIDRPMPNPEVREVDLPLILESDDQSGLIPPIGLPGQFAQDPRASFEHDPEAVFEAHGHELCASGCAASRHPTEQLTVEVYRQLLDEYQLEPINQTNNGLEALLFYGPQTARLLEAEGPGNLDQARADFLWQQLQCTGARVSLRVVDQQGNLRSWLDPTSVPFDRRHIFDMKTRELQPLVTSGTVKRVGLNHCWVRL